MALDFKARDVVHNIIAKFVHAFLPGAKKPYNLKAEFQPELDVHGVASKAVVYNINTDPAVIEEGVNAFIELVYYLLADGYKIRTLLFILGLKLPGEYTGDETGLTDGIVPEARFQTASALRKYIRETVKVKISGIEGDNGNIGQAIDEATGLIDDTATIGNVFTVRGHGIKIEGESINNVGFFFEPATGTPIQATIVAVNEPKTLKVIVPTGLIVGDDYKLTVVTQSPIKGGGTLLKASRRIESTFIIKAANP